MNYFQLLSIPVRLNADPGEVSKKCIMLRHQYETEILSAVTKDEQAAILANISMLNEAGRIFGSRMETIRYVLELKGVLKEEAMFEYSPNFLLEVMEIQEQLMNLEPENDPDEIRDIRESLEDLKRNNDEEVKNIIDNYQDGGSPESDLLLVREYYHQKKYLDRIQRQLDGIL